MRAMKREVVYSISLFFRVLKRIRGSLGIEIHVCEMINKKSDTRDGITSVLDNKYSCGPHATMATFVFCCLVFLV